MWTVAAARSARPAAAESKHDLLSLGPPPRRPLSSGVPPSDLSLSATNDRVMKGPSSPLFFRRPGGQERRNPGARKSPTAVDKNPGGGMTIRSIGRFARLPVSVAASRTCLPHRFRPSLLRFRFCVSGLKLLLVSGIAEPESAYFVCKACTVPVLRFSSPRGRVRPINADPRRLRA